MIRPETGTAVALAAALLLLAAPAAQAKPSQVPLPDLVVTKVAKPGGLTAGAKLSLKIQVRNKGRKAAAKSSIGVYLGTGKKHTSKDPRLARAKIKSLRTGKSAKATLKLTIPASAAAGLRRLIVCADDARKVRESKESDNCTASASFRLAAARPAQAFSMTDGVDWGFVEAFNGLSPGGRDPITVSLKAGNGIPGQAGYARSTLAPQPLLGGTTTSLDFGGNRNSSDDGSVRMILPFAFPFGGVEENSISVGSNGWVSFDGPASDRWGSNQGSDYRGANAVLANFERAIMPYWGDLELNEDPGSTQSINVVVAADGSYVAFQWDVEEFSEPNVRRHIQLVLFPDGRFRFDYPGVNKKGENHAFVGYSLGTGSAAALDTVAADVLDVPANSILFTPNPVPGAGVAPGGQATLALPADTKFISGDPGCAVTLAPTPNAAGSVSCPVPALAAGQGVTRTVIFAMPHAAFGLFAPADVHFSGTYTSGGLTLTDSEEIDTLSGAQLRPGTTIEVTPQYTSPPTPKVGTQALFMVKIKTSRGGLAEPSATFTLPANATLDSIQARGQALECGPVSGTQVTCKLPYGLAGDPIEVEVKVTPTAAAANAKLTLEASAQALNAALVSGKVESPAVEL